MTPKRILTESIVSCVEAVLSRQRDLSESAKDNIRSRITSTVESASVPDNNLTKDKQQALKRLKNGNNIVILPADKGRVTVVMDKTDYESEERSSQLIFQFKQLERRSLKKIRASTGFEPVTSAIPVRCSTN